MSLAILRKIISNIILENVPNDSEGIDTFARDEIERRRLRATRRRLESESPDMYENNLDPRFYSPDGRLLPITAMRATLKKFWNDNVYGAPSVRSKGVSGQGPTGNPELKKVQIARQKFWEDKEKKFQFVHFVGLWAKTDAETVKAFERTLRHQQSNPNESPDMSTIGFYDRPVYAYGDVGIQLKGRPTFAIANDAWTEELSTATPEIRNFHAQSGLPKRPAAGIRIDELILGEQDILNNLNGVAGEVVLENWTIVAVYIKRNTNKKLRRKLKNIAKKYNYTIKWM